MCQSGQSIRIEQPDVIQTYHYIMMSPTTADVGLADNHVSLGSRETR